MSLPGSIATVFQRIAPNVGARAGAEVAQLYISADRPGYPLRQLAGFERLYLPSGASQRLTFALSRQQFTRVLDQGQRILEGGTFQIAVGGGQPGYADGVITRAVSVHAEAADALPRH